MPTTAWVFLFWVPMTWLVAYAAGHVRGRRLGVQRVAEEEREACARVADAYRQRDNTILVSAAEHISTLIRARGKR